MNPDGCPKLLGAVCGNVGRVTWPETEIGEIASVPCRCGIKDPLIQLLKGTRRCGGTYEGGAMWEEPQCDSCMFTETRRELCALAEVGGLRCERLVNTDLLKGLKDFSYGILDTELCMQFLL